MQPDQGHPPDFNFIMNPAAPQKKKLLGGGDNKQRLLITIIAGGLVVLVIGMIIAVIFGGSSNSTDRLVGLAQQQTEIVRVTQLAEDNNASVDTRNMARTVKLSLTSARKQTTALITEQGQKVDAKSLTAKADTNTDDALTAARQANRFDEAFTATIQESLKAYQKELSSIYDASGSDTEKALLQDLYKQTEILVSTAP